MNLSLRVFKHLLPRARAWSLTVDKRLRQFFDGLGVVQDDVVAFYDGIYEDIFPQTTTQLTEWERQFGLIGGPTDEQGRRDRLDSAWKAVGGQSPRYLQDTVQAAGFPLFIHEWWILPLSGAPVAVDPTVWLTPFESGAPASQLGGLGTQLGGLLTTLGKSVDFSVPGAQLGRASTQLGGPLATLGGSRRLGVLLTNNLIPAPSTIPTDEAVWPYFLYWSGETFGEYVTLPAERKAELETLLLKLCPAQQWIGLFAEFA